MLKESIRFELQTRETYYKQLAVKDSIWWKHEINTLNDQIKKSKSPYSALAYQRIKAFLGIMCYSLTDNALQHHDLPTASRLLPVYAYLEPHNPDMFYFRALYSKTTGNNVNEIKYYLQKAIDAGFSDQEKIEALVDCSVFDQVIIIQQQEERLLAAEKVIDQEDQQGFDWRR